MWSSIHNKLYSSRDAAQGSNDSATVSGILLTAAAFDQSPPSTPREALNRLRVHLKGTKAIEYVESAFHSIVQ